MSGRARLPAGEPRKASQRNTRRAAAPSGPVQLTRIWKSGEPVRWKHHTGTFRRDAGDGENSEILIGERVYRVRTEEIG
jgi:hypothetical protein